MPGRKEGHRWRKSHCIRCKVPRGDEGPCSPREDAALLPPRSKRDAALRKLYGKVSDSDIAAILGLARQTVEAMRLEAGVELTEEDKVRFRVEKQAALDAEARARAAPFVLSPLPCRQAAAQAGVPPHIIAELRQATGATYRAPSPVLEELLAILAGGPLTSAEITRRWAATQVHARLATYVARGKIAKLSDGTYARLENDAHAVPLAPQADAHAPARLPVRPPQERAQHR